MKIIYTNNSIMIQAAVRNPSTAAAVPLPLTRAVGVKNEKNAMTPCPPCQRGEGHRSGGGILKRNCMPCFLCSIIVILFMLSLPLAALAGTHQVTGKLREDTSPFVFTLEYTADGDVFYLIHTIVVTHEGTGGELQRISIDPPAQTFADKDYGFGFVLEDMNFDGYLDMRLMQYVSTGFNIPYHCWLWDFVGNRFVYNEALSAVSSPIFDQEEKQVLGFSTGGAAEYIDSVYEFRGAELILVSRVTTGYDYEGGTVIVTTEELIEGQMIVTQVTREPLAQPEEGDFDW